MPVVADIPSTTAARQADSCEDGARFTTAALAAGFSPRPGKIATRVVGGTCLMIRRIVFAACVAVALGCLSSGNRAEAQNAYGQAWGGTYTSQDWNRFYHYPYVFYPQNFWGNEYYRSADSLYYRYPPEMRIPVYNRRWHNEYPNRRRYHQGHHFVLDVF
jgi:hypothetical protein